MGIIKGVSLVGMYGVEFLATIYALNIYMSYFKWWPCYEGSGMQFIANSIIIAPILGFFGLLYVILFRRIDMPFINVLMPWLVIGMVLINPFFAKLNVFRVSLGAAILIVLICTGLVFKLKHLLQT